MTSSISYKYGNKRKKSTIETTTSYLTFHVLENMTCYYSVSLSISLTVYNSLLVMKTYTERKHAHHKPTRSPLNFNRSTCAYSTVLMVSP